MVYFLLREHCVRVSAVPWVSSVIVNSLLVSLDSPHQSKSRKMEEIGASKPLLPDASSLGLESQQIVSFYEHCCRLSHTMGPFLQLNYLFSPVFCRLWIKSQLSSQLLLTVFSIDSKVFKQTQLFIQLFLTVFNGFLNRF